MVDHVVLFRFRPDLTADDLQSLFAELRGLANAVEGIVGFRGGAYRSPEGLGQGFTHGFVMAFADEAARDAYLPHPAHQRVVARLLPLLDGGLDGVVAFDFVDGCL